MMGKFKKVVNRDNYYSRQMKDFFWRLACCLLLYYLFAIKKFFVHLLDKTQFSSAP